MPEPLKEFEVIHPREPEDEPLTEYYQNFLGMWKQRYTTTGKLWIAFPWLLIIRKKLRCSLLELLIFIFALGSSEGAILRALIHHDKPGIMIVIVALVIVYGYLWLLAAVLYRQKLQPKNANSVPNGAYMVFYLFFPTLTLNVMGLLLLRA